VPYLLAGIPPPAVLSLRSWVSIRPGCSGAICEVKFIPIRASKDFPGIGDNEISDDDTLSTEAGPWFLCSGVSAGSSCTV
jgi:hypothetical protein